MRLNLSWQPLAWYVGIAVVEPLVNGAPFGTHLVTTLLVAGGFFLLVCLLRSGLIHRKAKSLLDR